MTKSKLRISCTTLDLFFTYLKHNEPEDWLYSKDKFIDMITVRSAPSNKMLNGILVHSIIETGKIPDSETEVSHDLINTCLSINKQLKDATFEFKWVKYYAKYNIDLVCKPDALLGNSIYEFKTTESFDYKKYLNSVQWKFYLDVFEADYIHYIVLPVKKISGMSPQSGRDYSFECESKNNIVMTDQTYQFSFHKSDYDKQQLNFLIEEFVSFINENNLMQYFQPK